MTTDPRLTSLAASLPATVPFVGPEAQERAQGAAFTARLGANESLFGPSPKAIAAMQSEAANTWQYADPEAHDLRTALAAHHAIPPENLRLGEGIDGLLGLIVRLFIAPGDVAVTSAGAYPTFNYHVTGHGGQIETVPYAQDHEDPTALIERARATGAKLIYISNPDNPMGSWHDAATIQRMIASVPDGALLLLDEAYGEFAPDGVLPPLDVSDPRVLRLRTFSKAYGLAGQRVGYAIGTEQIIAAFDRVRNHFGLNKLGQAGALAALQDPDWLSHVLAETANGRARLAEIAAASGMTSLPSATNFVTIDCGQNGAFARRVLTALINERIFVRMPFVAPQDRCIRVSAGRSQDIEAFAVALPKALTTARNTEP